MEKNKQTNQKTVAYWEMNEAENELVAHQIVSMLTFLLALQFSSQFWLLTLRQNAASVSLSWLYGRQVSPQQQTNKQNKKNLASTFTWITSTVHHSPSNHLHGSFEICWTVKYQCWALSVWTEQNKNHIIHKLTLDGIFVREWMYSNFTKVPVDLFENKIFSAHIKKIQ